MLCPKKLAVTANGVERAARKGRWHKIVVFVFSTPDVEVLSWYSYSIKRDIHMHGVVVHYERRIGYIVIRDVIGEFTVAELLGGYDIAEGHIVSGELHCLGGETLMDETEEQAIEVFVQGYGMSEQQSILMLRGTR